MNMYNGKIKIVHFLFFVMIAFNANGVDKEYCLKLETLAKTENIQKLLLNWVDLKYSGSTIPRNDVTRYYTGIRPGIYTLKKHSFDWGMLNFDEQKSRIKLMGLENGDFYDGHNRMPAQSASVTSVFFAERSYYGILVKLNTSDYFVKAEYKKDVTMISDRIAIYCGFSLERK